MEFLIKMKKNITVVVAVISMIASFTVNAAYTQSHDNTSTYLTGIKDMSYLSVGFTGSTLERKLKNNNYDLEGYKGSFYTGVDLLKWFSVYGRIGVVAADFSSDIFSELDGSTEFTYGVGAVARLLNHDILDSFGAIDKIRIIAWADYDFYSTDTSRGSYDWEELCMGATISVVNEIHGEPDYTLDSIALYFGPVYSTYFGDLEEDQSIGLTAGVEIYFTPRISVTLGFDTYDFESPSVYGSLDLQF
jgi:opacity protein-like surface antigen